MNLKDILRVGGALALLAGMSFAADKGTEDGEKPKKDGPVVLSFVLKDGTKIQGKIIASDIVVNTSFGKLTIPIENVVSIKFGKNSDPDLKKKVDDLIAQLGDPSFEKREKAMEELGKLGSLAYQELEKATKSKDEEIQLRATKLVEDIQNQLGDEEAPRDEDVVVTDVFSPVGIVDIESLKIDTNHGTLSVKKADIDTIQAPQSRKTSDSVKVAGTNLANVSWAETSVKVNKGDRFVVKTSGSIFVTNWGVNMTPEGNRSYGTWQAGSLQIPMGALVGKIGPNGKVFLVGSNYTGKAEDEGSLQLGLALHANMGANSGEFKAEVKIQD